MYELLGICLALAALLAINALASLATVALWRGLARCARRWSAATRAQVIFTLRVFPAMAALISVAAFLIPAYAAHEPRHTAEVVGAKLAALASVSAIGIALAAWRGMAAWLATQRLTADWLRHAEPIQVDGMAIPSYRIRHSFPVIAVVGVIRPKLFVAGHVFDSLSGEEISAVVAHEGGHLAARDNLRRGVIRACRDVLTIVPCGQRLDRAWAEASESAADEHGASAGASVALDLAAALIKIARLVPEGARPTMPAGALLIGDDPGSIGWRVHRLTQLAAAGDRPQERRASAPSLAIWVCLYLILVAVALTAFRPNIQVTVHAALEQIVSALQ